MTEGELILTFRKEIARLICITRTIVKRTVNDTAAPKLGSNMYKDLQEPTGTLPYLPGTADVQAADASVILTAA